MKTKVISVRLQSLVSISDKACKATAFDGSSDIIPKSQVFGEDYDVEKSEAYWISEWILDKKNIQYSTKKIGWYNSETEKIQIPIKIIVEHHIPIKINPINKEPDASLTR